MEAYAVTALHHAVRASTPAAARRWAGWTAAGALLLGLAGQVAYHLLASAGRTSAPWPVTVLVSSVPVLALGAAAMLWHLLGRPDVQVDAESAPDELGRPQLVAELGCPPELLWTPLDAALPALDASTLDVVRTAGYDIGRDHLPRTRPPVRTANGHARTATAVQEPDVWARWEASGRSWPWPDLAAELTAELGTPITPEAARKRAGRRPTTPKDDAR